MIRSLALGAGFVALVCASSATAQSGVVPDAEKGKQIATQVCAACHAPDGNSVAAVNPKLAGQFPEYLYRQLTHFKPQAGKRPARENAVMTGMVASLSDADMRNLGAYYARQPLKPAVARDKNLAALGQRLYRGGNMARGLPACASCHGPDGAGMPAQFPRLAGQYAEYIESQLQAFRAGSRTNDPNGMMRGVAARMSDGEIKAVAEYTAGLR